MALANAPAPPPPAAAAPRPGGQAQPAKLISNPPPAYPPMARTQRLQGEVVLDVSIDADGKVTKVNVVSGHAVFQQAAVDAVMRWRYEPARLNGQPVPTQAQVRVFFRP
jgi:protein TonB